MSKGYWRKLIITTLMIIVSFTGWYIYENFVGTMEDVSYISSTDYNQYENRTYLHLVIQKNYESVRIWVNGNHTLNPGYYFIKTQGHHLLEYQRVDHIG